MILKPVFRDYLLKLVEAHDIEHQYYMSPGGTGMVEKFIKLILVFRLQLLVYVHDIFIVQELVFDIETILQLDLYFQRSHL